MSDILRAHSVLIPVCAQWRDVAITNTSLVITSPADCVLSLSVSDVTSSNTGSESRERYCYSSNVGKKEFLLSCFIIN